jgi:hypothetical protein
VLEGLITDLAAGRPTKYSQAAQRAGEPVMSRENLEDLSSLV